MVPFTTAERKVLGVAAPSQAQTQFNWIYPAPPNPYGLQPHLAGYVNQIYVQAANSDGRAAGDPPDHRDPRPPPPHQARRRQRFLRAQPEPDRGSRRELEPHHGAAARRRRLDLAGGRRHRHHEHPAGVGDRAHARDRPAHGDRRAPPACAAAVPRRGGVPERDRRRRRHHHGRRVLRGDLVHRRLVGADLGARRSPAASCSPPRSGFSSATIRRAKPRASIRSRRCATSRLQAPGSIRCSTRSRRTK